MLVSKSRNLMSNIYKWFGECVIHCTKPFLGISIGIKHNKNVCILGSKLQTNLQNHIFVWCKEDMKAQLLQLMCLSLLYYGSSGFGKGFVNSNGFHFNRL